MSCTMKNKIPKFKNENEEREFWSSHDSVDYVDWSESEDAVFPKLRPTVKNISIRLPEMMIDQLKILAHKRDIPYQSLMKTFLAERIEKELSY